MGKVPCGQDRGRDDGLPIDRVNVRLGDSDYPVSTGSGGQVIGAMTMGVGGALMEHLAVDKRHGFFVNHDETGVRVRDYPVRLDKLLPKLPALA
jgi:CO/xanthine dehydrogenase Mo-binding subunit